ncbi:alpha/beta hydrolase [Streptomyces platensis]|uniref:alpha/beta hydrolase n=1 Tax=Streptomyces platensis TaxID=58346 RepID=UPI002ED324CD|nr:alpha/beta hydrolase [Streptomyces platensis]
MPPTVVALRYLPAGPDAVPLVGASYHHNYASSTQRHAEADWATTFADKTWTTSAGTAVKMPVLMGGDNNSYPVPGAPGDLPLPVLEEIRDRTHRVRRSCIDPHGTRRMCTCPDETLRTAGLEDVAPHVASRSGNTRALARTVNGCATSGVAPGWNGAVLLCISAVVKISKLWTATLVAASAALGLAAVPAASATPAQTAAPQQAPADAQGSGATLTSYRLAPGLLKNTSAKDSGNPSQVHGVLGMPKGKGPHPVVLVVHGTHPNCVPTGAKGIADRPVKTRWPLVCLDPDDPRPQPGLGQDYLRQDAGLSYLVEELARKGFVAVAVDAVAAEQWWVGEPNPDKGYTQLIDAHLKLLSDLNKGIGHGLKIPGAKGRIDTSRVGLVGHSRGGGYVLSQKAAQRAGLFGAVALEPAAPAEPATHRVPVLNIRGACDEDTGPDAGRDTVKDLARSGRTAVAADVVLPGTGHAMLNTNLFPAHADGPGCSAGKAAAPASARAQTAQLTASFLQQALHKAPAYRLPALRGVTPKGGNLHTGGPSVTFRQAPRAAFTDPLRIPEVSSDERLLPAIPKDLKVNKSEDF